MTHAFAPLMPRWRPSPPRLSACAVGPELCAAFRPASRRPSRKPPAGRPPRPPTPSTAATGGRLFGDPALTALEAKVQVSNQNIIAAEAAYREARAG